MAGAAGRITGSRVAALCGGALAAGVLALLATAGLAQAKVSAALASRPNIVLIQADDAIRGDVRFMPHVQRLLAAGGATFSDFVSPYPLCAPARANLLTGQFAHNHQVAANFRANDGGSLRFAELPGKLNERNSLGRWMQRAGYRTALVGKYLHEYGAEDRTVIPPGWDRWVGLVDNSTYDYFNYLMNIDGKLRYRGDPAYADAHVRFAEDNLRDGPNSFVELLQAFHEAYQPFDYFGTQVDSDYTMDVTGRYAARFVQRQAPRRRPFFLYYAPPGPHAEDVNHIQGIRQGAPGPDPRPPARYAHAFDDEPLPRPPAFNEADVSDKASNLRDLPLLSDAQIEEIEANYRGRLGAMRALDDQVGRIVKQLRRAGELRDTYLIFTSDNGYIQGEHRLRSSKFMPYENSIRVPALVRGPGVKPGRTLSRPAIDVDLTATVLDIAGAEPGRRLDGISWLPALRGKRALPKRDVPLEALRPLFRFTTPLTAFDLPFYGVRTSRYKYIHWSFGEVELYDLKRDPDELVNLASDPAHADTLARLEAESVRLQSCRGAAACR